MDPNVSTRSKFTRTTIDEEPRNQSRSNRNPAGRQGFSKEMQGDAARQSHAITRRSLPYSRRGSDDDSRNQHPPCAVHTRGVGRRRLKVSQRRSIQFVDGAMPGQRHSGGKVLWNGTRKVKNRIAVTLRMAAQSLQQSESALRVFYRPMRTKLGAPKAVTAAAHKLARIVFHLIKTREPYDDSVFAKAEHRYLQRMENRLKAQAHALGYTLVPSQS
jgi:hypothetical protein